MLIGDNVIMPSDAEPAAHLYSFDARNGELRWKVKFDYGVATTPIAASDGALIVATSALPSPANSPTAI